MTELSRAPFTKDISNITPKLHTLSILARSVSLFPTPGEMKALYQWRSSFSVKCIVSIWGMKN